jgi:thiamine-phosphate pyrophosphorylase
MAIPVDFGFYGILTNPVVGYERLAEIMVQCFVPFIQLRMKDTPKKTILKKARSIRKITQGTQSRFIINDNPLLALESGADGVHLGQEDTSYEKAREILGPNSIIGISTHTVEQTISACAINPDYIGIGPVFSSATKKEADPTIGIDGLKKMLQKATVPAVAIGGISQYNARLVIDAGARNVAAIGCITQSADPANPLEQLIRVIEESKRD